MSFFADQAATMARRLHALQASAPKDSAAARLLPSRAVNVAVYLTGNVRPNASDAEVIGALAAFECRDPSAFALPGTFARAPERLPPEERSRIAKMSAEEKLAMANAKLAEAAKKSGKP